LRPPIQNRYLFYLHGKIIEDLGIPAISPEFGEYEYLAILGRFKEKGFIVISEERTKDTDSQRYAQRVTGQILQLLNTGVQAENIIVVGASKGAGIALYVSHLLNNKDVHFVIMAICSPDILEELENGQITLKGEFLSIYDASDEEAGSCRDLFSSSLGDDVSRSDEIMLNLGLGHGMLYQPLDEWILPIVDWVSHNQ
jgi:hypothetical protein